MKNRALFEQYTADILAHELFQQEKAVYAHGTITLYEHSLNVAELAFSLAEGIPGADLRCAARAGLLHDFFLYEWHVWGKRYVTHGWAHPRIAADNARRVFGISDKEYECIRRHMWPWTLFHFPVSREGWLISLADKAAALREAALCRGRRKALRDPRINADG